MSDFEWINLLYLYTNFLYNIPKLLMIRNLDLEHSDIEFKSVQFHSKEELEHHSSMNDSIEVQEPRPKDMRSQYPLPRNHPTLDHKLNLVKLMVRVKFDRFGFRQPNLDNIIDRQLSLIENLEHIEPKQLSNVATQVFLDVFASIIGERGFIRPRNRIVMEEESEELPPRPMVIEIRSMSRQQNEERIGDINEPRPQILCNICYTIVSNYVQQECQHSFCTDCMKGYLQQNIRQNNYFIKCAQYECKSLISISIIKKILSPRQYNRFIHFRTKNQLQLDPDNKFCSRPDCGELLEEKNEKLVCNACGTEYCEVCLQEWHGDRQCNMVLREALEMTYNILAIKKCPGCKSPIQKSDGCNHMTCKKCRYEFCWLCQKKYSKHHFRYYNCLGCPGMMFEDPDQAIIERIRQICLYFSLPFILSLLLLSYVAVLPVFMVGSWLIKPCAWAQEKAQFLQCSIASCICFGGTCPSLILSWILLQPRALLYSIFVAPVKLTSMMCGEICQIFD